MYRVRKQCNDKLVFESENFNEFIDFFKNYNGWHRIYGVYEKI